MNAPDTQLGTDVTGVLTRWVKKNVAAAAGVDIQPDTNLFMDIGMDSLEAVMFLEFIESLRGGEIDIGSLNVKDFTNIESIVIRFFRPETEDQSR